MSPLLWHGDQKPPEDDGKLVGAFLWLTLTMWAVVVIGMMLR